MGSSRIAIMETPESERPSVLDELFDRFLSDIGAGRTVELSQVLSLHPELQGQVRATFELAQTIAVQKPRQMVQIPGYELLLEIGRGGMGQVYLARDKTLGRMVALKTLTSARVVGEAGKERFAREIRAIARLSHPNIVQVHASGLADDVPFFTMEHVSGCTLAELIHRLRSLEKSPAELRGRDVAEAVNGREAHEVPEAWRNTYVEAVCRVVGEVGEALQHAHEQGVIHRDVKPSNVMLRRDGRALLFDFGLAQVDDEDSLTRSGAFVGTPCYASPEQLDHRKRVVDARTDVYSLGVTLYELLTLAVPFRGGPTPEIMRRVLSEEPPKLRKRNPSISKDLETICCTALEKDPERRYASAREFSADLRHLLAFEPIQARQTSAWTRTRKLVQRNKAVTSALGLGLLLCLGTPSALWLQQRQANLKITQINKFLGDMFGSVDPANEGYEAKVADVLDQAVLDLERSFGERDDVQLPLREILANAYQSLGLFAKARGLFASLRDAYAEKLGADSEKTLEMGLGLAFNERNLGSLDEGQRIVEQALITAGRALGVDAPLTLTLEFEMCSFLLDRGDFVAAERRLRALIATRERTLPHDHEHTLATKGVLANLLFETGRVREAMDIYDELLPIYSALKSTSDPATLTVRANRAVGLYRLGRVDEALTEMEAVLELRGKRYSPSHKCYLETLTNLAEVYRISNRCERGLELLDRARPGLEMLRQEHKTRLDASYKRARILLGLGRFPEAESEARKVWQIRARPDVLGPTALPTFEARYVIAQALHKAGRLQDALKEYDAIVHDAREAVDRKVFHRWWFQDGLAACLLDLKRFSEAEPLLQESLAALRETFGDGHLEVAYCREKLAYLHSATNESRPQSR